MDILLVEDNENIISGLEYAFSKNNYNLVSKTNIKSAVEYLNVEKPELIILDVSLPDGNGFDLYKSAIKEKEIPVIFLTARDDEDDVIKGLSLGAEDYMTKPFSTKELLVRVKNIILRNNKISIINVKEYWYDKKRI